MTILNHVAIIMDGNGRWANNRLRPRIWGHVRGSSVVSEIVREADNLGLSALTLYAFSTENWCRPLDEVSSLFRLLKKFLLKEKQRILANDIQFKVIGEVENLPRDTVDLIREVEAASASAQGLKLTFAFSYGGRAEILRAVNSHIGAHPGKPVSENSLSNLMFRPESGDVDLMIRTGGEQRISNFLLWQMAYAELYFTPTKWPDFTASEFRKIIEHVSSRERRFGGVAACTTLNLSLAGAEANKSTFVHGGNV